MPRVFLSYDREDVERARPVALALERGGHSVWWDRHIKGGSQFSKEIERALRECSAVVVLWSKRSVDSSWVRDEAAAGRDTGRLVPVLIDGTEPPLGFRQYQAIDLSKSRGRQRQQRIEELLGAVASVAGTAPPRSAAARPARPFAGRWVAAALAAAALVAALYAGSRYVASDEPGVPTIAVASADDLPATRALARDLLIKLGSLQEASADRMHLVAHRAAGKPADLVLEVAGSGKKSEAGSSLALFAGTNRSLLWSKEFGQATGTEVDRKQQLAYTAANVIGCALEGLATGGQRLDQQTLRLYLNGCSAASDPSVDSLLGLRGVFREVTRKAPAFEGGWANLLLVEGDMVTAPDFLGESSSIELALRDHIAAARKLNPKLAEADLAAAGLMTKRAWSQRMSLVQRAVRNDPENAYALSNYSHYLQMVGRMEESVRQARRAAQLAPLSPAIRDNLIGALTYAGRFETALEEVRRAERLWPGASSVASARYRLHLRYGDPREAVRLQVSRTDLFNVDMRDSFLQARIDPSPEKIDRAVRDVRLIFARYPGTISELAQVLGAFGREEELFPILLGWRHPETVDYIADVLFRPALRNAHRDPRMIAVAQRIGLLDYWRASGEWPDFCFDAQLPYDCKAEAAKLAA